MSHTKTLCSLAAAVNLEVTFPLDYMRESLSCFYPSIKSHSILYTKWNTCDLLKWTLPEAYGEWDEGDFVIADTESCIRMVFCILQFYCCELT